MPGGRAYRMPGVREGDLLLSGLQHFAFCRRQWALIHIEMQWTDNYLTVDGRLRHERTDDPDLTEKRGDLLISRAMPVRSERYGMAGKCDVVEFRADPCGVPLAGRDGLWLPTPVEYKRGHQKENDADRLQLCAEAMCLEEMLCCPPIPSACLYYMETRRREVVPLTAELREKVARMLTEMRALYDRGYTPRVRPTAGCRACSLSDICLPKLLKYPSAAAYVQTVWDGGEDDA